MDYYKHLNIDSLLGHEVTIRTFDGENIKGILEIDQINETWEEDGEKEAIGIRKLNTKYIIAIELDEIASIQKSSENPQVNSSDKVGIKTG